MRLSVLRRLSPRKAEPGESWTHDHSRHHTGLRGRDPRAQREGPGGRGDPAECALLAGTALLCLGGRERRGHRLDRVPAAEVTGWTVSTQRHPAPRAGSGGFCQRGGRLTGCASALPAHIAGGWAVRPPGGPLLRACTGRRRVDGSQHLQERHGLQTRLPRGTGSSWARRTGGDPVSIVSWSGEQNPLFTEWGARPSGAFSC